MYPSQKGFSLGKKKKWMEEWVQITYPPISPVLFMGHRYVYNMLAQGCNEKTTYYDLEMKMDHENTPKNM